MKKPEQKKIKGGRMEIKTFTTKTMPKYVLNSGVVGFIIDTDGEQFFGTLDAKITHLVTNPENKGFLASVKLEYPPTMDEVIGKYQQKKGGKQ